MAGILGQIEKASTGKRGWFNPRDGQRSRNHPFGYGVNGAEAAEQAHDPLVLGEGLEVEPLDPKRPTYFGQQPDQEPPDAAALPVVDHRYRNLR
jgi:hypothetical protein